MKEFKSKKYIYEIPALTLDQICKLNEYKIRTIEDLISAYIDTDEHLYLLTNVFITESSFQNVINQANLMKIHGINKLSVKLLNLVGIDTINQLANQDAKELNLKLIKGNRNYSIAKINRSDWTIQKWIDQAKELVDKEKLYVL